MCDKTNKQIQIMDDDKYDYGPLIRFNMCAISILYKYGNMMNSTECMLYKQLSRYKMTIGKGCIHKNNPSIKHIIEHGKNTELFLKTILNSKSDSDILKRLHIRSPSFVRHKHMPFDENTKIQTNNYILRTILCLNPYAERQDAYFELHCMWAYIDSKKWNNFANPTVGKVDTLSQGTVNTDRKLETKNSFYRFMTQIIMILLFLKVITLSY